MSKHMWNGGWQASFCLKCGDWNLIEHAIADGLYDPSNKTWVEGVNLENYNNGDCPISDVEYISVASSDGTEE